LTVLLDAHFSTLCVLPSGDVRLVIAALHRQISSLHIPLCDQLSPLRGVLQSLLDRMKPRERDGRRNKRGSSRAATGATGGATDDSRRAPRARSLISQPELDYCVQVLYL
jgi:hypothetical protein